MKKYLILLASAVILLVFSALSSAEGTKIITLKDGSVLNGKVLQLNDGIYTFETSNLGNITIPESNVLSITTSEGIQPAGQSAGSSSEAQKALLKSQVQSMQGTIMKDQEIQSDIQNLVEDEAIKNILADPALMNDVMSFDQDKIQQNKGVQELMNNPKMQELINKVQQKLPSQ